MKNFHFGENLRIIRSAKGISQEAMAMGLHVVQSTYSRLEKSPVIPPRVMVEKICKVLGEDPTVILSKKQLDDLVAKVPFEDQANKILQTWPGIFFTGYYRYLLLMLPILWARAFVKGWVLPRRQRKWFDS